MPAKKPQEIKGFKFVGTSPVHIIGLGELKEGDVVPLEKAKEIWGDDFVGSEFLVPVEGDTGQGTREIPSPQSPVPNQGGET